MDKPQIHPKLKIERIPNLMPKPIKIQISSKYIFLISWQKKKKCQIYRVQIKIMYQIHNLIDTFDGVKIRNK